MRHTLHVLIVLLLSGVASTAEAWWAPEWTHRSRIVLDTSAKGLETRDSAQAVPLAVRLHSGNFDFVAAKEDGSDLRVLAADDKTPLVFRIERYDPVNELALLWVQVPTVLPGTDQNLLYVYHGNTQAPAAVSSGTGFDAAALAVFHLGDTEGADVAGQLKASAPLATETDGLLAGAAKLSGAAITWPANDRLKLVPEGARTVSLWIKPAAVDRGTLFQQGPLTIGMQGGKLVASIGTTRLEGGAPAAAAWQHVAVTLGAGKAALYLNGAQVAQADAPAPALDGPLAVGDGVTGSVDELQIASVARSGAWLALAAASQGIGGRLVSGTLEAADAAGAEEGGHGGYLGILVANLTIDAWVVIGILAVMFVIAAWVMITKTLFIGRTARDNGSFLDRFHDAKQDMLQLDQGAAHPNSSIYRLYQAGLRELRKRDVGRSQTPLSGASLDAVKAAVDADMVRETHRLNAQMVLLTIAISGGPFLGLLGTVVGVMITFAAIAAAGDVNVNAIAPGIAAALLATVAGLAVAIPALFGYNYLASQIKNLSAEMQIFVDEFITRVAEVYGAR